MNKRDIDKVGIYLGNYYKGLRYTVKDDILTFKVKEIPIFFPLKDDGHKRDIEEYKVFQEKYNQMKLDTLKEGSIAIERYSKNELQELLEWAYIRVKVFENNEFNMDM